MGKVSKKDFLSSFDGLNAEEKAFMEKHAELMCDIVNKALEDHISSTDAEKRFENIKTKLDSALSENTTLKTKIDELQELVKKVTEETEKIKAVGVGVDTMNKFNKWFDSVMDSPKMKNLINGLEKSTGYFSGISLKDISTITSVTDDLKTPVHLANQSNLLVNPFKQPKLALRDIIKVVQADPEHPNFTFLRVSKFDRNARYETENGRLKQSSFAIEEVDVKPRRIGSYFDLSKNILMARLQLRAWLLSMIPGIIVQAENASILFGDGANNTLLGIANEEGVTSIEAQLTDAIVSGKAGSVKSVGQHKNGIRVELNEAASLALDSMMITFEGAAVNTDLATPHPIIKVNDFELVVLNVEYKGEETAVDQMSFKINHPSFKSIEDPNSKDVIMAIFACLSFAQYSPNAIVLNPLTVFEISTEKDAIGRDLNLVQTVNNVKYIGGIPVIETSVIPKDEYLAGDFENGAFLFDYTKLEIAFAEDAETVLYNMVRLWFQEQLGLCTTMPWAFAKGKLSALREALAADQSDLSLKLEEETTVNG
ncbi:MAG: phage major capsid protein [Muribaculaceae bacterium]|nr:phage major capsid protein [Muribaculaceae bacterium]